jgi:hypothetical protein
MSIAATAQLPMSVLDDDAWDDLLSFIEERRVIPILGPELLRVETDRGPRLLYEWLAEKLAARLNVNTAQLPQPSHRASLLKEAAALLDAAAPPLKPLREIRLWRERVRQAQ